MSGTEQLLKLRDELNAAIDSLAVSEAHSTKPTLPPLEAVSHAPPATLMHPEAARAAATARKIAALLSGPSLVYNFAISGHLPACISAAINAHAAEAIRQGEAQPGTGLSASEIAKASTVDPAKLTRVLRLLAANHIFVEKEPGVFANNRCSIGLDTGKSIEQLKENPSDAYEGTDGRVALVAHCADEGLKATAHLSDTLLDTKTSHSYKPEHAPASHAYDRPIFDFWAAPGNEAYVKRFGMAMYAINTIIQGEATLATGFPFTNLPAGSKIVDVGGGVGSVCLYLRKLAPQLQFVVQDRPEVIEKQAPAIWREQAPEALEDGSAVLQAHDFFLADHPIKDASVFLLRLVIHDWADAEALAILRPLAATATTETRLLLIEQAYEALEPDPLVLNPTPYFVDLQMLGMLNAQERTEQQYVELAKQAGWTHVKTWVPTVGDAPSAWRHYEFKRA
ncbi:hypothetical protein JCM10908_004514 [Rhodotorula pacifica]|uniref:uncharacterized protein n=1 Tax=Rhodotorula pacifica TaxID=1495444 RepID=UPI0031822CC9